MYMDCALSTFTFYFKNLLTHLQVFYYYNISFMYAVCLEHLKIKYDLYFIVHLQRQPYLLILKFI